MTDKQLINALKAGDRVDSYFSVAYKKPVSPYKYGHMFEFRAVDRTGQITVKYWGGADQDKVTDLQGSLRRGDVVRVFGEVGEFRDQLEISISEKNGGKFERLKEGDYDLSGLLVTMDGIPEMKERLKAFANGVEEPHISRLLRSFFDDDEFMEEFASCPASMQLHSAAIGGLLHHTLNVAEICSKVLLLHPNLDRDLVMAGALLHDIGKIRSFSVSTSIDHTTEGNLVGHMVIGDEELMGRLRAIDGFPDDLALKLRHILASHHGRREWGSPVEPMMPEALLVHEADDLDAKLDYMVSRREGAVTEDDWMWDKRLGRLIYLR
ncbi:TPA: HD domain-containing protein [Thermoplasmata archaeon]|nr:HD domain-containing protein [Thermoplasmata archaeon]